MLHLLNRAYLGLHVSNYDSVTADLQACSALLDRVPDQQGLQARQLRVHLLILGASVALATGSLKDMELGAPTRAGSTAMPLPCRACSWHCTRVWLWSRGSVIGCWVW